MSANEVIILISENRIFFNEKIFVPVENTNLPFHEISFSKIKHVFWKTEQLDFDIEKGALRLNVTDYFQKEDPSFYKQQPKLEIREIEFSALWDTDNLKRCLKYSIHYVIDDVSEKDEVQLTIDPAQSPGKKIIAPKLTDWVPASEEIRLHFSVSFNDLKFGLGYVSFYKYIHEVGDKINFKIPNENILAEFDFIKNYFARILKTKKIKVKATVVLKNNKVHSVSARSPQILLIDQELIDSVKQLRTFGLTKSPRLTDINKSLFTADEIFESDIEHKSRNIFEQDDNSILKLLLEKSKVRNRKQLEYLAGEIQSPREKLRFTLAPDFGFLFLAEGDSMYHFIWELLNTHATYIWSIDRSEQELRLQYKRIEDTINYIRRSGRDDYKRAYRNTHIDQDLSFSVIFHEDASSPFKEGFVKWKQRLLERIL